jgi:hypothetical protein
MTVQPGFAYAAVDFGTSGLPPTQIGVAYTAVNVGTSGLAPTINGQLRADFLTIGQATDSNLTFDRSDRRQTVRVIKQSTAISIRVFMRSTADGKGLSGLTLTITICKVGASSFSSISPAVTDLGNGWYNLALTSSHTDTLGDTPLRITAPNANTNDEVIFQVVGFDPTDANALGLAMLTFPTGAVVTDAGNTAATFKTNLASTVDNFYKDAYLRITSGALNQQVKKITGYTGSTKFVTVLGGFTSAPSGSDTFFIVDM